MRVHAAAVQLGYRPNLAARALVTGRSGVVWFLAGSLASPTEHLPAEAAARLCRDHGRDLLVATHHGDPAAHQRLLERLRQGVADGAVIAANQPDVDSPLLRELAASGFPLVFIDRHVPHIVAPVATTDHVGATLALMARLRAEGITHIANLHLPVGNTVEVARYQALLAAVPAAGLTLVDHARPLPLRTAIVTSAWGHFSAWRRTHAALPVGTWICHYDYLMGDPPAGCTVLALEQDFVGMATAALELLNRRLEGQPASSEIRYLPLANLRVTRGTA